MPVASRPRPRTTAPRPQPQSSRPRSQSQPARPQVTRMRRVVQPKPMINSSQAGWAQYRYVEGPLHTHRTRPRETGKPNTAWNQAIIARSRSRKIPWLASFGVATTSTLSWGMTSLFGTIDVPPLWPSLAVSTIPLVAGAIAACHARPQPKWWPDLAAAVLAGAGMTFWLGMCGPTWWTLLVLFVATVLCGARWWAAHPVGPGEKSLKPAPVATAQPAPATEPAKPVEADRYADLWLKRVAFGREAKLPGSRLKNLGEREHAVDYRIEMRSDYTFDDLKGHQVRIAGLLGLPRKRVFFTPCSSEEAPSVAYLTIVTGDPVSGTRYYTGPTVHGGEICNLARFEDGSGELSITMFDEDGTKSVAVAGGQGGGKSAASNELITGALSTGAMNLLYIDPKGNSSTALRKRARIVLLGHEAAMRAPELVQALNTARGDYAMATEQDVLLPSRTEPGWTIMHDEFMAVTGDTKVRQAWARMSNQMRAYGIWQITANQALHESKWGDDATRAALTQQVIAFRINSSSDQLLPGMSYRPNDLPVDHQGNTIPGHATQLGVARPNVPALWDLLPRDGDSRHPEAPYTISTAFDAFFDQPDPLDTDRAAIESILGPANADGRWVVGGPGATHEFPTEAQLKAKKKARTRISSSSAPSAPARRSDGFGLAPVDETEDDATVDETTESEDEQGLDRVPRAVLAVIRGGTTRAGEIVTAAQASRAAVYSALDQLAALGLIHNPGRGVYEAVEQ